MNHTTHQRARELMERYSWKYELAKYAAQLEERVRELEAEMRAKENF